MSNRIADDILMHIGTATSGRYPKGSGEDPHQHSGDLLSRVEKLKKEGLSQKEIADYMGLSTTKLRTQISLANDERRAPLYEKAKALKDQGYTPTQIAREMGYTNESSVRSLLNEKSAARMNEAKATVNFIREQVDKKGMIDVGVGVERELGISKEKLKQALYMLELEGYPTYGGGVPQVTAAGKQTNIQVICKPGTQHKEIFDFSKVHTLKDYISHDDGETFDTFKYPKSMDSKRINIRYAEDGGVHKDGVVEIRRGVDDISLGKSRYAQVRILVDDTKYIKGMAVYEDDSNFPPGVDIIFNTNKHKNVEKMDVLKKITDDPDNPFGSLIKSPGGQSYYIDKDGNKQLSVINKRAEEGDWGSWSDKLPSQFLAKQNKSLIDKQLKMTAEDKYAEFEEIKSLTNPTVKKVLLKSFSDDCDAAAIHLKAAALPGQKYQVILPITTMKDNEVYAPNFENGSKVALVRFPHGGTFEIPILTVNNKHKDAKRILGEHPKDAVGINSKVAERLSGADFDGDTVMVVPTGNGKVNISSKPPLKGLEGFDNKMSYGHDEVKEGPDGVKHYYRNGKEYKIMNNTQTEMGKISNLITDMTLKGADDDELARAVKHSMVVIDAEKHKLDYHASEKENGISTLKKRYQGVTEEDGSYHEGAATLLSRAKSKVQVPKTKGQPWINEETGEIEWSRINPKTGKFETKIVDETYDKVKVNPKTGVETITTHTRTKESTRMAETKDARTLSSGTIQEEAYANYANQMKSLGNAARKEMVSTGKIQTTTEAKNKYKLEVDSLQGKLNIALKNAPRERAAQTLTNAAVTAKQQSNPDMTKSELKKLKQQELAKARAFVGAKRKDIEITDKEWEAIQAGAVSENELFKIINNVNIDSLRERATPRATTTLSSAKINKIEALLANGTSTYDIAKSIGVSVSTVQDYIK